VSVRKAWSSIRSVTASPPARPSLHLQPELGVADLDRVSVDQVGLSFQDGAVEQRPVGRVHVLDEEAPVAREDAGVQARGIAILDLDVGVLGAADREAADQVEALVAFEPDAALDDKPGVGGARLGESRGGVEAGGVGGGRNRPPQVLQRPPRDHEQEEVEDGQEAELQGYRYGVVVHAPGTLRPASATARCRSGTWSCRR
jgi:hypothetical protein